LLAVLAQFLDLLTLRVNALVLRFEAVDQRLDYGRCRCLAGLDLARPRLPPLAPRLDRGDHDAADNARAAERAESHLDPRRKVDHGTPQSGNACPLSSPNTSAIRPCRAASSSGSKLLHGSRT